MFTLNSQSPDALLASMVLDLSELDVDAILPRLIYSGCVSSNPIIETVFSTQNPM